MPYLHNNRIRIEKFVYEQGINVALYNAEQSKKYQKIQRDFEKALNKQVATIGKDENTMDTLVMLAKKADHPLLGQVAVLINKMPINEQVELAAYLVYAGELGGQSALDKLGIDAVFGLKNQQVIDYFGDYSNLLLDDIDETTTKFVADTIQKGKDEGLSPFEIAKNLIDTGKAINAIRAERIVLTETARAMTLIEIEEAQRLGIRKKIWRTSRDDRVDPICIELEGKEAAIKGLFVGGYEGPPAHVSCRCYIEEVIPDDWQIPENIWVGD